MSNVLRTAAVVVGAVALVASGIGAAGGIGLFGSVAAGTMSAATAATLATVATVGTVASVAAAALTIASGLTAKKPSAQASGSQTQFSADPDAGIPLVIGRTGNASDITFRRGWDTNDAGDNDRQCFVAVHSLGPIDAVESFTVDRSPVTFDGAGRAIGAFAGFMWMVSQLGATPEPAALTFGAGAGTPPGWTADHKLSGKAASAWTLRFDTKAKLYQNGVPAPMWTIRGIKAYDPRKDSTYPGGNGPHRMADPADTAAYDAAVDTWEWTEDPYLIGLRWAHGIWQRDRSNPESFYQRVMGMGAPWSTIDVPAFVEGANVAQANGWKVGGVIYSGDGKWDGMKKILQAGMGEPLTLGARISCLVNAPKVSLATITVDDLVGPGSVSATQPRRDRVNTITPRLRLEENNWRLLPAAPISVPEHVAEDRGKRSRIQDYPYIQQTKQAAVAARYDIENAREFGPINLPLKLVWMGYKPGDCVTALLPELGLNGQTILLLSRELSPASGIVTMTARSETAGKHPFALGETTTPPPTPGVSGPPLVPVPGTSSWSIVASKIEAEGSVSPAIVIAGATDAATAEAVVIEYRRFVSGQSMDAGWLSAGTFEPSLTRHVITGVEGGTAYEAGISYQRRGVTGGRLIIGPSDTAGTALDFDNVIGPNKPENGATNGATVGNNFYDFDGNLVDREAFFNDALTFKSDGELVRRLGEQIIPLGRLDIVDAGGATAEALAAANEANAQALANAKQAAADADAVLTAGAARLAASGEQTIRQMIRAQASVDDALHLITIEAQRTRDVFRDAGIVIDPATGTARIYAIEQQADALSKVSIELAAQQAKITLSATRTFVQEQILLAQLPEQTADLNPLLARITNTEIAIDALLGQVATKANAVTLTALQQTVTNVSEVLDALAGTVSTKVDQTVFDALGASVGSIEQTLSALGDVSSIVTTLSQARSSIRTSAENAYASLGAVLAGDVADRYVLDAIANARQELYTKAVDGLTAEAGARLQLAAQFSNANANQLALYDLAQTARAAGDAANAQAIEQLAARVMNENAAMAAQVKADREASVTRDGANATAINLLSARSTRADADSAYASLDAALNGSDAQQRVIDLLATVRQELYTRTVNGLSAEAGSRLELAARLTTVSQALTALIVAERVARVDGLGSVASVIEALTAQLAGEVDTILAQIVTEREASVARDNAQVQATTALATELRDADSSIRARVSDNDGASVTRDAANADRTEQVLAALQAVDYGLSADITAKEAASVARDGANASRIEQVRAALEGADAAISADVAAKESASVSRDAANADRTEQVLAALQSVDYALSADIVAKEQASVTRDQANAASIAQVSARLNGAGGGNVTVEQALSAAADAINGIRAEYSIKLQGQTANGIPIIGGFGLLLNGGTIRAAFAVDEFVIGSPGANGLAVFEVVDGVVRMREAAIGNLTVGTLKLKNGSVTQRAAVSSAQDYFGEGSTLITVASYSLVIAYPAEVIISMTGRQSYAGSIPDFGAQLLVNGVAYEGPSGGATFGQASFADTFKVSLPAGTHSLAMQWRGGSSAITLRKGSIIIDATFK